MECPADYHPQQHLRLRRRRRCVCLLVTAAALLLLAVTILVLSLTVLRVRDPTTRLVSVSFAGAPSLAPLNVTLLLAMDVRNPNAASFSYASGHAQLWYRGALVGDGDFDPGRLPSRGNATVHLVMTVLGESLSSELLAQLMADVEAGAVPLDAGARIPGKVAIFKVVKLRAVAYSNCHLVFGFPEMRVRSQECQDHAKL
ncbi:hypothetical protein ACP4OV_005726 [Aristida adscensionis]